MNRRAKLLAISVPAAAVGCLLLAVGVEIWTRWQWNERKGVPGFFLSDPGRIQRLAPGYTGWFAGVPVKINQLGFRDDREYRLEKSPSTFRILVLGDSVTFGHGSVYEHSYPYLLEQRLKAWRHDVDWQVWNVAVPGYNTSQELAHLLEVGPSFAPDLVVVGFFENDIVENFPVKSPGLLKRARSIVLSWLYRHVYSIELYKRLYLQIAWTFSGENSYRQRLVHIEAEEQVIANPAQIQDLDQQHLTPFDRLPDEAVTDCPKAPRLSPDLLQVIQRERGWSDWLTAVRRFQQLHRDRAYSVVFFANLVPLTCPDVDVFYDGGTARLNRFYLQILADGTPAVSVYDTFRHLRPSQMPFASGHSLGNSNSVKAEVLFEYLREHVLANPIPGRAGAISRPLPSR
jgi:GDSL-like lipase/acylhydrolase family protein